jgi:ribosomal protein S18 acetylase RimI-like enzyme
VRCYVEPSPAGGYFVRLRGEPAPLSRHDTEEEAEAAAAAYERGQDTGEHVTLSDGAEVLIRAGEETVSALAGGETVAVARYRPEPERPHVAAAELTVDAAWRDRGLEDKLVRRLTERARANRIRVLVVDGDERPISSR